MTGDVLALVAVTPFHLRSIRFLPVFLLHAHRTIAQIRKADGFIAGAVRRDAGAAFWTLTLWRDETAMRVHGSSGAPRRAAPQLATWADEASAVHWRQPGRDLPSWPEAARRMREQGRTLPLRHPAPTHADLSFSEAPMTQGMRL